MKIVRLAQAVQTNNLALHHNPALLIIEGTSKNLSLLVFSVANFIFLSEGRELINELQVIFLQPFPSEFLFVKFLEVPLILWGKTASNFDHPSFVSYSRIRRQLTCPVE
jgi:hypothetical protein